MSANGGGDSCGTSGSDPEKDTGGSSPSQIYSVKDLALLFWISSFHLHRYSIAYPCYVLKLSEVRNGAEQLTNKRRQLPEFIFPAAINWKMFRIPITVLDFDCKSKDILSPRGP